LCVLDLPILPEDEGPRPNAQRVEPTPTSSHLMFKQNMSYMRVMCLEQHMFFLYIAKPLQWHNVDIFHWSPSLVLWSFVGDAQPAQRRSLSGLGITPSGTVFRFAIRPPFRGGWGSPCRRPTHSCSEWMNGCVGNFAGSDSCLTALAEGSMLLGSPPPKGRDPRGEADLMLLAPRQRARP